MLIYSILQSYNFDRNRIDITPDTRFVPQPPEEFIMSKAYGKSKRALFTKHPSKSIELPEGVITLCKNDSKESPEYICANISNPYIKIELKLSYLMHVSGLSYTNPYYQMALQSSSEIHDKASEMYESYSFRLDMKITRLFPEVMTSDYYKSYEFAQDFGQKLIKNWDINYFMKSYPHINKLYSIEYKLDKLTDLLDTESKK